MFALVCPGKSKGKVLWSQRVMDSKSPSCPARAMTPRPAVMHRRFPMFHVLLSPVLALLLVAALSGAARASDADPPDDTDAGSMIIHGG